MPRGKEKRKTQGPHREICAEIEFLPLFFEGLHGPNGLLVTPKSSESRASCRVTTAAGRPPQKVPCLVLGTAADAGQKGLAGPWQESRGEDGGEKKNRLPAVPQWKMIPRFKTRVYVLFVFPALSVSVEGRRCEREALVFHWQGKTKKGASFCENQLLFSGR